MNNKYIIYMKAGPYCGYSLKEIEKIKNNEDKLYGKFYWGYGGVFCHPKRVLEFVKSAIKRGEKILVYFSITKSKFNSPIPRCHYQSADKNNWKRLSSEVILVGNQYSLVCTNLKRAIFLLIFLIIRQPWETNQVKVWGTMLNIELIKRRLF